MKVSPEREEFYREVVRTLARHKIPFLVGGSFALHYHTGLVRDTGDLDIYLEPERLDEALEGFSAIGLANRKVADHWLAKVWRGSEWVDLIVRSANGLCRVSADWFRDSHPHSLFQETVAFISAEHLFWMKAYVMERERFDGADLMHILKGGHAQIRWERLWELFREDRPLLLAYLILFQYVYPREAAKVPLPLLERLWSELRQAATHPGDYPNVCRGTLLSRLQYLQDISRWGLIDARRLPRVEMTEEQIEQWTRYDATGSEPQSESGKMSDVEQYPGPSGNQPEKQGKTEKQQHPEADEKLIKPDHPMPSRDKEKDHDEEDR